VHSAGVLSTLTVAALTMGDMHLFTPPLASQLVGARGVCTRTLLKEQGTLLSGHYRGVVLP